MICCSENCLKSDNCSRYLKNYVAREGIVETIESLATFGSGHFDSNGIHSNHYLCGPCGNYAMYEEMTKESTLIS